MTSRPTRLKLLALVATSIAVSIGPPAPAHAGVEYQFHANATSVCQYKYGTGLASTYAWNPDSLYCYQLSIPWGMTYLGVITRGDFLNYCRANYGRRAYAIVGSGWRNPTSAWLCAKRV
jgi:hypothetical protein